MELKAFHARLVKDPKDSPSQLLPLPVIHIIENDTIQQNFQKVQQEITDLVNAEMARIQADADLTGLLVIRNNKNV
jgi:hypothetical protein